MALMQKLKIFGVRFSYFPLNGFLWIFGTLLCSRPTMSFRWEAIMLEVYRLSMVDICQQKLSQKVVKEKKNARWSPRGKSCADNISCNFKSLWLKWKRDNPCNVKFLVLLEFNKKTFHCLIVHREWTVSNLLRREWESENTSVPRLLVFKREQYYHA